MASPQSPGKRARAGGTGRQVLSLLGEAARLAWRGIWPDLRQNWKKRLGQAAVGLPAVLAAWLFVDIEIRFNDRQAIARRAAAFGGLGLTPYFVYGQPPPLFTLADKAALRHGIDPLLFRALVTQESAWNSSAVSAKGAAGLTQLMPATAKEFCGLEPDERFEPEKNLDCGARYLARQIRRFQSVELALAAYNAGPERVAQLGRIPRIAETENYVAKILVNWNGGAGT
jgi:soluble lytic murein transglycosylase-like protein